MNWGRFRDVLGGLTSLERLWVDVTDEGVSRPDNLAACQDVIEAELIDLVQKGVLHFCR